MKNKIALFILFSIGMLFLAGCQFFSGFSSDYDHYVYLKPITELSLNQLEEAKEIIISRLEANDFIIPKSKVDNGIIVLKIPKELVTYNSLWESILIGGKFEAKIANDTTFVGGKKDITYVCRSAQCSGIDPQKGCFAVTDGYACSFFFSISLSPEAADRQAKLTEKLSVITADDKESFLSGDMVLYLDDKEVDRLKIGAELKGKSIDAIQISGSGTGLTQEDAINNALQNMKRLQTIIQFGELPGTFEIVNIG